MMDEMGRGDPEGGGDTHRAAALHDLAASLAGITDAPTQLGNAS